MKKNQGAKKLSKAKGRRVSTRAQSYPTAIPSIEQLCRQTDFHPALRNLIGHCLYRAAIRFKARLDNSLTEIGINSPCLAILRIVEFEKQISQHDLGKYLAIDKASMVKFIDHLEKQNILTREADQKDRRVKNITLTKVGHKRLQEAKDSHEHLEKEIMQHLSLESRKQLHDLLLSLLEPLTSTNVAG